MAPPAGLNPLDGLRLAEAAVSDWVPIGLKPVPSLLDGFDPKVGLNPADPADVFSWESEVTLNGVEPAEAVEFGVDLKGVEPALEKRLVLAGDVSGVVDPLH